MNLEQILRTAHGEIDLLEVCLEDITSRLSLACENLTRKFAGNFVSYEANGTVVIMVTQIWLQGTTVKIAGTQCNTLRGVTKVTKRRRSTLFQNINSISGNYDSLIKSS